MKFVSSSISALPHHPETNQIAAMARTSERTPARRHPAFFTSIDLLDDQRGIGAAESEAVVERGAHFALLGLLGHEIDAFGAFVRIARMQKLASTAPAPPSRCPIADLVLLIDAPLRSSPSTRLTAPSSIVSAMVDVPCALT